jgi:hypothetical protein
MLVCIDIRMGEKYPEQVQKGFRFSQWLTIYGQPFLLHNGEHYIIIPENLIRKERYYYGKTIHCRKLLFVCSKLK